MAVIKTKTKLLLAGLLCVMLWSDPVHGQSSVLMDTYQQYFKMNALGRYQEAIPFAETALRMGEVELGSEHLRFAILLNNLAELYKKRDRYGEAESLHKRSLAIFEKALGSDHPDVASRLESYVEFLWATGCTDDADKMEARAMANRAKSTE